MSDSATLYICYFGLRKPLVQTQVLTYLREIKKIDGLKISLLTFEPEMSKRWTAAEIESEKTKLAQQGIKWYCLPYHKRFSILATAYDVLNGAWFVRKTLAHERVDVLHCRVHVPALMGALGRKFSRQKPRLLFDIRGFMPEEYTDAGVWPEGGWLYRTVKKVEKWLIGQADGFVVLTEKARNILFPESSKTGTDNFGRPVEVIPCCVDLSRFGQPNDHERERRRAELGVSDRFVVSYVGSFGGWYLTDSMIDFFKTAREQRPETFLMILTQSGGVAERLKAAGFGEEDFFVGKVPPAEVPRYLAAADVAISFIKACFSKLSSSPTKIPEYLGAGLPVISNKGIGDIDELITKERVGVLLDLDPHGYRAALEEVEVLMEEKHFAERSADIARNQFDLETIGGERYRRLYRSLLAM